MKKIIPLFGLSICCMLTGYSQAGKFDSSFGGTGWVKEDFVKVNFYYETITQILLQKNGSYYLVLGGLNGGPNALARYRSDGTLDKRYGKDGYLFIPNRTVFKAVQQSQGKIIVASSSFYDDVNKTINITRYNTNGSADSTFNGNGTLSTGFRITSIMLQSDDKIVVMGGTRKDIITRYNGDGLPDDSFKPDEKLATRYTFNDIIEVQKDGKLVVQAGFFTPFNCARCCPCSGTTDPVLLRLNNDGTLDQGFGNDGKVITPDGIIAVQKDGKIILVSTKGNAIVPARYNRDGSIDTNFNKGGEQPADFGDGIFPNSIVIQNNGKIIIVGSTGANDPNYSIDFAIIRYNKNGSLDNSFDEDGKVVTDFGYNDFADAVAIHSNGKLMVAGGTTSTDNWDYALAWYNSDGSPDDKVYAAGKKVGYVPVGVGSLNNIAVQGDGKKVVAGIANDSRNRARFFVARYNKNGTSDKTFGDDGKQTTDFGYSNAYLNSIAIQNDGKIVAAGSVTNEFAYPTPAQGYFALARYNTDGTPDSTFSDDGKQLTIPGDDYLSANASSLAIQQDGKIVVVGTATDIEYNQSWLVTRYNSDGSIDSSFDTDGKLFLKFPSSYDYASSVGIQQDQKIVVAGGTRINGTSDFALVRLNPDGTFDPGFGMGGIQITDIAGKDDVVRCLAIQNDGKVVVAGTININDIDYDFAIIRYNTDGSLDDSFDDDGKVTTDFGYNDGPNSINFQLDGKIIVTGSTYNGGQLIGNDIVIARYDNKGTLDDSFGTHGIVTTDFGGPDRSDDAVLFNNKLYVTGNSTSLAYDLFGTGNLLPIVIISTKGDIVNFSAPATIKLNALTSTENGTIRKVQFYNGSILLKTDKKYPYQFSWMNVPQGTYSIVARATDDKGLSAFSNTLLLEVMEGASLAVQSQTNSGTSLTTTFIEEPLQLRISPNPTSSMLSIRTKGLEGNSQATIQVISSTGAIIKTLRYNSSVQVVQLDLTRINSGVYTVKFTNGNKIFYKQFIKL